MNVQSWGHSCFFFFRLSFLPQLSLMNLWFHEKIPPTPASERLARRIYCWAKHPPTCLFLQTQMLSLFARGHLQAQITAHLWHSSCWIGPQRGFVPGQWGLVHMDSDSNVHFVGKDSFLISKSPSSRARTRSGLYCSPTSLPDHSFSFLLAYLSMPLSVFLY